MGLCGARLVCSVVELLSKSQSDGVHTNAIGTSSLIVACSLIYSYTFGEQAQRCCTLWQRASVWRLCGAARLSREATWLKL
jgi:hypothetical protein